MCDSAQDCGDDGRVCVLIPGGDPTQKFCTARECSADQPCADASMECVGGICISTGVPDDVIEGDVPEGDLPPAGDATDAGGEVPPQPQGVDCKPCENKADCGDGAFCTSVGGGKFCLTACETDADCKGGYICYQASSEGLQCLPVSYSCEACAYDGCEAGKCCDLVSGECPDCLDVCELCTYDFQCSPGLRCYKTAGNPSGNCVAECGDTGSCDDPASFTCGDNGNGIQVCVPVNDDVCSICPEDKPYTLPDGTCVECLNSTHCEGEDVCDQGSHTCGDKQCGGDSHLCDDDKQCHQCCEDAHCAGLGGTGKCIDYECEGVQDNCGNSCADPYPVCANVGGTWQCVACDTDDDCPVNCTCSTQFLCIDVNGQTCGGPDQNCQSTCDTAADCPPGPNSETLDCHSTGVCFNPAGGCDGITSCCGPNQQCFDLMSLMFGGMGGIPGMPIAMGACSCDTETDCLGGEPCADMGILCLIPIISDMICAGGSLPAGVPAKMCFDIGSLLPI